MVQDMKNEKATTVSSENVDDALQAMKLGNEIMAAYTVQSRKEIDELQERIIQKGKQYKVLYERHQKVVAADRAKIKALNDKLARLSEMNKKLSILNQRQSEEIQRLRTESVQTTMPALSPDPTTNINNAAHSAPPSSPNKPIVLSLPFVDDRQNQSLPPIPPNNMVSNDMASNQHRIEQLQLDPLPVNTGMSGRKRSRSNDSDDDTEQAHIHRPLKRPQRKKQKISSSTTNNKQTNTKKINFIDICSSSDSDEDIDRNLWNSKISPKQEADSISTQQRIMIKPEQTTPVKKESNDDAAAPFSDDKIAYW